MVVVVVVVVVVVAISCMPRISLSYISNIILMSN